MKPKQVHIYIDGLYGSNIDNISKKLNFYAKQTFSKEYKVPYNVKEPFVKSFKEDVKNYYNKNQDDTNVENWHYIYESSQKRKAEYHKVRMKHNQIIIHSRGWISDLIYSDGNFPKWDHTNKNILANSIYVMVKPSQSVVLNNLEGKRKRFEVLTRENYHNYADRVRHLYMNLAQRKVIKDYIQIADTAPHTNVKTVLNDIRELLI